MDHKMQGEYRRSIWDHDERYDLRIEKFTSRAIKDISLLASVDAAKKQVPPTPMLSLGRIASFARKALRKPSLSRAAVEEYLRLAIKEPGIGIPTAICMLAVLSKGKCAPMDRKVAAGLLRRRLISDRDHRALTRLDIESFVKVYVRKVTPAWQRARRSQSPQEVDSNWAMDGRRNA